ncbi:MAG TPA: hypothetical protein VGV60_06785 [Candidatus Polarisedimenticolia bacterium]|nr:hypothetical protein [Candidatus Polarisedimenticolia bacterium]
MRNYRASGGRFPERPYYKEVQFERITSTELESVGLMPSSPKPIRVDWFIEKRFNITPEYEDLGSRVLGVTLFGERGAEQVIISRALEDGSLVGSRRARTTMAHEAGHILLHGHLFALGIDEPLLFGDFNDTGAPRVMCREGELEDGNGAKPRYEWHEFQANRAMSALLLPKKLVAMAIEKFVAPKGRLGLMSLPETLRGDAVRDLAEVFDVNPAVVRIRMDLLYPESGQGTL